MERSSILSVDLIRDAEAFEAVIYMQRSLSAVQVYFSKHNTDDVKPVKWTVVQSVSNPTTGCWGVHYEITWAYL